MDLVGCKFGRLTVLCLDHYDSRKRKYWFCQCDCGIAKPIRSDHLTSGATQSCGCYRNQLARISKKNSFEGKRFGRLLVIMYLPPIPESTHSKWFCICDCGNISLATSFSLTSGHTKSCGCYGREKRLEANSGENSHFWKGGITPLHKQIRTSLEYKAWRGSIFDRDDYTCSMCKNVGGTLNAHHIKRFANIIADNNVQSMSQAQECQELWDINNGITLCENCHKEVHKEIK